MGMIVFGLPRVNASAPSKASHVCGSIGKGDRTLAETKTNERCSALTSTQYTGFEAAWRDGCRTGLFRTVGELYRNAGQLGSHWRQMLDHFTKAGATNLNLGRLLEGHANAAQLICLYGNRDQKALLETIVEDGQAFGVWGAGGTPQASVGADGQNATFYGAKRYASGLGTVSHAIVPVAQEDGILQLYLIPASDPARQDVSRWSMSGMRESASGVFLLDGLPADETTILGEPGVYKTEPFFEGGIWRCAAVHAGAIDAIVRLMSQHLDLTGRLDHPLQAERLGHAIMHARTARLWVEDAARRIEAPADGESISQAVAISSYARLQVETSALAVVELARRSVGLASFEVGCPLDLVIADLSVYLRQANPDALLLHKCRTMAADYLR